MDQSRENGYGIRLFFRAETTLSQRKKACQSGFAEGFAGRVIGGANGVKTRAKKEKL